MAPGSRGIGAVFVHSSGEDSDQTGDAFGEPRVPRRSRSHYLSNAPGLADQLVASRKDSAREGGSCAAYFCKVPDSRESELGLVRYGPASRVHRGVFGPFEGSFPIRIPADPDKFLAIREFHVVHGCVLFPMCPGSQINLLRVRKTLCASAATSVGKFRKFQHSLISSACFHARGRRSSRCRISDDLGIVGKLALPTFSTVQALHRGELGFARYDLANRGRRNVPYAKGGGQFDPVFGLVNSPVKPWSNLVNLGQTWSDLVKALQTLGNVPRTSFQGFLGKADPSRAGNSSVKPRFKFGDSLAWDDHPSLKPGMNRGRIGLGDHPGLETETNRGRIGLGDHPGLETKFVIRVRIGLGDHPGLETETNRGRIGLGDHPGLETKFVIRVRIGLGDHPGLETETNRGRIGLGDHPGLETKFVIRVRIGLGDHPGLETETNRGRIGLGDHPGLETKFVIRVRIGLGDHPGLETETNRGRIGLGDHPGLETKFVIRVRIGLGDHPGLETETNRGRIGLGDHPGLETKFVIRVRIGLGDHPGLETETNRGRIGLGDHPGLETKFVIRVRIGLGDHPGLETETNRGRIGLGDHPGLETKFVIRVRIGLGDHPGLETEANRGRIGLGDNPVYLAFLALGLPVALSYRCLTEVVVAEIVAGPHLSLLGFVADGGIPCGPFLRDFGSVCFRCHASFIEVVVALFVGSECTCIPYFRLSYLTGRHFLNLRSAWLNLRLFQLIPDGGSTSLISGLSSNFSVRGKIAPVWYNEINEFLIPGASILSPIWEILQEVSIRLDDVDLQ
uniref:Uncharacterized protein n=1 Tax=Fagus sylvatica TaxID=28930 RepID=A0A2N9HHD3_FAGSY